jgi:hypothetical protein
MAANDNERQRTTTIDNEYQRKAAHHSEPDKLTATFFTCAPDQLDTYEMKHLPNPDDYRKARFSDRADFSPALVSLSLACVHCRSL